MSFSVSEFVALEGGRRVMLHEERGFTVGWRSSGAPDSRGAHPRMTADAIVRDVLNVVLPDDDGRGDEHPWSWLAELARARGLDVTEQDLRGVPYRVVLTEEVSRWLAGG